MIGVGNEWRGDDGAGPAVARRLGGRVHQGDCTALLDAWAGADEVVVVDAAAPAGAAGTVSRFDAVAGPLPARLLASSSSHSVGVPEAVELARALEQLPRRLTVYAIEGARFDAGEVLSPAVEHAVATVAGELTSAISGGRLRDQRR